MSNHLLGIIFTICGGGIWGLIITEASNDGWKTNWKKVFVFLMLQFFAFVLLHKSLGLLGIS